ncbi:hypothetical protein [Limisalsivibrio acetivorans]|uniref:hypothetical protein n=1 Tax=Limisalsivibrio acetivorans TaxID=1304888 RepID=UPI0003B53CE7|nr:hypothetical protein [Limisalsivibrio acetivorans]
MSRKIKIKLNFKELTRCAKLLMFWEEYKCYIASLELFDGDNNQIKEISKEEIIDIILQLIFHKRKEPIDDLTTEHNKAMIGNFDYLDYLAHNKKNKFIRNVLSSAIKENLEAGHQYQQLPESVIAYCVDNTAGTLKKVGRGKNIEDRTPQTDYYYISADVALALWALEFILNIPPTKNNATELKESGCDYLAKKLSSSYDSILGHRRDKVNSFYLDKKKINQILNHFDSLNKNERHEYLAHMIKRTSDFNF